LSGLGSHHLTSATLDIVKALLGTLDDHYPLRFRVLYVVNAPFIVNMAWKIIQNFVHETTRNQVKILSGNPAATLLKEIDADQLPKALGGTLVINGDPYCNPPIVAGGRLKNFPGFQATPSVYNKEGKLPMELYVKARQSVRIGRGSKAGEDEAPNLDSAQDEPKNLFQATVTLMQDWVENLQAAVQAALQNDEESANDEDASHDIEPGAGAAIKDASDTLADGPAETKKCCCLIS